MKTQQISWVNVSRRIVLVLLLLVWLPWPGQAAAPDEFVVSQTLDSGPYSLRAGIEFANSYPGPNIIRFDSNLTGNTILLNSNLPPLTDDGTTIDASPNWVGSWPTGEPGIGLTKSEFDSTATLGLHIKGADNCLIKGLRIEGLATAIFISAGDDPGNRATGNTIGAGLPGGRMLIRACHSHAVVIQNSDSNRVIGCYIGTSKAGNLPEPNGGVGVYIGNGRFNEIGGTGPLEGNLIGASAYGVWIDGSNAVSNTVQANRIGIGMLDGDIGNEGHGIIISGHASHNQVGGTSPDAGNWISGNDYGGVMLSSFSSFNKVSWNDISDNDRHGIEIIQSYNNNINWNNITGNGQHGLVLDDGTRSNRVEGNVIAQNKESGIVVVNSNTSDNLILHNYIGLTPNGQPLGNTYYGVGVIGSPRNAIHSNIIAYNGAPAGVWISEAAAVGNGIWFNSIYNNTGPGIVLTNSGNKNLAAPSITQVQCPRVSGVGAPANGKVQLFSDEADEGRFYEGEAQANSSGQWVYIGGFHGPHLTATALDSENNTSAFSAPVAGSFCGVVYLPVIRR